MQGRHFVDPWEQSLKPAHRKILRKAALLAVSGLLVGLSSSGADADDESLGPPANVFISPSGQPFRAKEGAPYPVVDWFKQADKNADGRLDKAELVADAETFFRKLDLNGDGVLSPREVANYEQRVAPEILGYRVEVSLEGGWAASARPRLWRVQIDRPSAIDPGGDAPPAEPRSPHVLDESGAGASPFGFFDEPEPVMAADLHFRGTVAKADFLKLADAHFATLDHDNVGYLTLAALPRTPMQKRLERGRRRR